MPKKFFRRRFSRRVSYDEEIDQPEVLLRRKVGKLLIPDIFKGNSTDEDQSSQSSKGLGEWDIPDWMPKKRAVRRQTQSHQHDHVKNAAKRARDMWANRSQKKKIFFRPPGLPLVKRKKNKVVGKSRSDTEPLVETSHLTRNRRTQTEGSKLRENLPRSSPQKHSNKPGRLSYISPVL